MVRRSHLSCAAKIFTLCLSVFLVVLGSVICGRGQSNSNAAPNQATEALAQRLPGAPTGASRCMFYHPAEVEGYSRSAMAHSLRRTAQEPEGTLSAHGSTITMHSSPTLVRAD